MPGSTDRVLDVLAELGVPATFFCVGVNAQRHPRLLRRIADEGHSVGSHSMTHPHPKYLSPRQVRVEYTTGRAAVEQALGAPAPLFRPPHGHQSMGTVPLLRSHRPWLWSCDPQDWRPGASRDAISRTLAAARPGGVVLMHDWVEQPEAPEALDRTATIEALPAAVGALRARGVEFCRLRP
jgi:peptidoglycan/xylan/chitin deacetylase (PgdA/CDA1 family)